MAAKSKTVDVIDFTDIPYEAEDTKSKIIEKYSIAGDFTHIYLKRYQKGGELANLRKYDNLPDEEEIKNEYGGGKFELWIHFPDPSTANGRNMVKVPILIEGTSIIPDHAGTNKPAAAQPVDPEAAEEKMLDKLAKYKVIFGNTGNQENGTIQLVLKQLESQNNMILEMIKSQGKSGNSKLEEILLTKAFERNTSDLDIFLKAKKIFDTGNPSPDEWAWLKSMAPALLPLVAGALRGNKQPAAAGIEGAGDPAQLPPSNELITTINQIATAVNNINERMVKIENEVKDIKEGIEPIPDDENEEIPPAQPDGPPSLVMVDTQTPAAADEPDPNDPLYAIAQQIAAAPEAEKINELATWVNTAGAQATYDFCLKYKLVEDLSGFNAWMKKAGLPDFVL